MRWSLTLALLALAAVPAAAEETEAEKLFRGTEKKVRAAKTLKLRSDSIITGADGKKGNVKVTLTLGEGDKLRAEFDGKLFGEALKVTLASDGTTMKSILDGKGGKKDKDEESSKGVGTFFRGALPRQGAFLCLFMMDRRGELPSGDFTLSDFKLAGKEKIAGRNTQAIQFMVKFKGAKHADSVKLWLDAKTQLPVQLAFTAGKSTTSDITAVTETYGEFTLDAKVDEKSFKLPK